MYDKREELEEPDYDRILEKQDFFPKIFLIPSQIRLHKDEGIKVIKRSPNHPDKFQQEKVLPISVNEQQIKSFKKLQSNESPIRHPAGHGLLSLFKKTAKRRIKLAICICVYSEPKHMLKSTIKGIQESYKYFLQKAGIMPHEIILTVIFDGIEKVNNSKDQTQNMISFFNEIDIKNGFVHRPYGKSLDEYLKDLENRNFNISKFEAQKQQENVNLFTEQELSQLKVKLFQNQYNQYTRIKALQSEIAKLKKQKNIKVQSLPHEINKKYQELCLNFCIQNNMYYQTQQQIQEYLSTKKSSRVKLIYEAINQTELLCKRYLDSRQDKAILYPVRIQSNDLKNPRNIEDTQELQSMKDIIQKKSRKKEYNYMFFVVKHKNEGKLSSHMLFFQGFCKLFDPQYCMLTDVGIKPHKDAIYKMFSHMQLNPKCGGVCGYMGLQLENPSDDLGYRQDGYQAENLDCLTRFTQYFFTVQRAQQFQYHFAHMLDKPFEAAFGYIHVLPGAFSGYRWKALKSVQFQAKQYPDQPDYNELSTDRDLTFTNDLNQDEDEQTIMKRYLKTATADHQQINLQDSNMYLAEDRIMCLGIHALGYNLDYLPDAESIVDPVTSLTRLLGQRRRWINGSWFAFQYVKSHKSQRTTFKFLIQLWYYIFVEKLSWIGPAMFYIAMNLTLISAVREYVVPLFVQFFKVKNDYDLYNYSVYVFNLKNVLQSIPDVINFIYILMIFSVVLHSLLVNNNNQKFKKIYYLASSLLGVYGIGVFSLLIYNSYQIISDTIKNKNKQAFIIPIFYLRLLIISVLVGHALPIVWTFNIKKYIQILTSLFSYLFYTPTYVNILQIFAFCRIDDISWGTKGLDSTQANTIAKQWERRKYIFVLQYISTNVIVSYICIKLTELDYARNLLILGTTCLVAFMLVFRLIPAAFYLLRYNFRKVFGKKFSTEYINKNMENGTRILNALRIIQLKIKQIEKFEVKKKKQAQFKKLANATEQLLSKSMSNFGNKLRSKVAHHMVHNNIIPKKQILQKRMRLKKKINLRKKLKTVQQLSNEQSEGSNPNIIINGNISSKDVVASQVINYDDPRNSYINYDYVISQHKKSDIKTRIQNIKKRRSNKNIQKQELSPQKN